MSDCASATSMLEIRVAKIGWPIRPRRSAALRPARAAPPAKPYQAGSMIRACDQLKTHGIARRSSIRRLAVREAGRLPMFRPTISEIGVAAQKKASKPGVS